MKTENTTKIIGIICVISIEAKPIEMLGLSRLTSNPFPIYKGEHNGNTYYLSICDLGKANAAAATQSLIDKFKVDEIFNAGICGALSNQLSITDIVISKHFIQHDFNIDEQGQHCCWPPLLKLISLKQSCQLFFKRLNYIRRIINSVQLHRGTNLLNLNRLKMHYLNKRAP